MRAALHILLTDDEGQRLPPGARAIAVTLAYAVTAGVLGDLLLYAIELRAQGSLSARSLVLSLGPFLVGFAIILLAVPAILTIRHRTRWWVILYSALLLAAGGVLSLDLIAELHDDCARIPGCMHRATVIYFVSFDQFLYFTIVLAAWAALMIAFVRAIWLSVRGAE